MFRKYQAMNIQNIIYELLKAAAFRWAFIKICRTVFYSQTFSSFGCLGTYGLDKIDVIIGINCSYILVFHFFSIKTYTSERNSSVHHKIT